MEARPNYYMLLDIDPEVDDAASIASAIQKKTRDWSLLSTQGRPSERSEAARNKEHLKDIRLVMNDPETRREEAADARRRMQHELRNQFARLDEFVAVLRHKGQFTAEDVAQISESLGNTLSEHQVLASLQAAGLQLSTTHDSTPASALTPRLDPASMDQLRPSLDLLGIKSLYEFLKMDSGSSVEKLRGEANRIRKEITRVALTNAESHAGRKLCADCLTLFRTEDDKVKYDNALTFEIMEKMRPLIELAGRDNNFLSADEQNELVQQARERSVHERDARAYLAQFAQRHGWVVQPTTRGKTIDKTARGGGGPALFRFLGRDHHTVEELAQSFADNWDDAAEWWPRNHQTIRDWVRHQLGLREVADSLERIDRTKDLDLDAQVFSVIVALDPNRPPRFRGIELSDAAIASVAGKWQTEPPAAEMIQRLYRSSILHIASSLPRGRGLLQIQNAWTGAAADFANLLGQLGRNGVSVAGLQLDDVRLIRLLSAATPGSSAMDSLRKQADAAGIPESLDCPWFRDLFDAAKRSPAAAMLVPDLAGIAQTQARERRRREHEEQATRQQQEREEQARRHYEDAIQRHGPFAGGCAGLLYGSVLAIIPCWLVTGVIGSFAGQPKWGLFWLGWLGLALVGMFVGRSKKVGERWIANAARNPEVAKQKGLLISVPCLLASAALVSFVIYYQTTEQAREQERRANVATQQLLQAARQQREAEQQRQQALVAEQQRQALAAEQQREQQRQQAIAAEQQALAAERQRQQQQQQQRQDAAEAQQKLQQASTAVQQPKEAGADRPRNTPAGSIWLPPQAPSVVQQQRQYKPPGSPKQQLSSLSTFPASPAPGNQVTESRNARAALGRVTEVHADLDYVVFSAPGVSLSNGDVVTIQTASGSQQVTVQRSSGSDYSAASQQGTRSIKVGNQVSR